MTQTDLKRVYYLKKELEMWQKKLSECQADIALGVKQLDGMPRAVTNNTSNPTEAKAIKLSEVSRIIEGKISEIQFAISEIDAYIVSIEDPIMRIILECRCCMLMSWDAVAQAVGGSHTAESVRQMYHRFTQSLPK